MSHYPREFQTCRGFTVHFVVLVAERPAAGQWVSVYVSVSKKDTTTYKSHSLSGAGWGGVVLTYKCCARIYKMILDQWVSYPKCFDEAGPAYALFTGFCFRPRPADTFLRQVFANRLFAIFSYKLLRLMGCIIFTLILHSVQQTCRRADAAGS